VDSCISITTPNDTNARITITCPRSYDAEQSLAKCGSYDCIIYNDRVQVSNIYLYNRTEYSIFSPPPLPPPPPPTPESMCLGVFRPVASTYTASFAEGCAKLRADGSCDAYVREVNSLFQRSDAIFMWCGLSDYAFTRQDCNDYLELDTLYRFQSGMAFDPIQEPFDRTCSQGLTGYYCKCVPIVHPPPNAPVLSPPPPTPAPPTAPTSPVDNTFVFPECRDGDGDIFFPTPCGFDLTRDCLSDMCLYWSSISNQTGWSYGYPQARFWTSLTVPGIFDTSALPSPLSKNDSYYCPPLACRVTCKKSCEQVAAPTFPPAPSLPPDLSLPWYFTLPLWAYIVLGVILLVVGVISIVFAPSIFTRDCLAGFLAVLNAIRGSNIFPGANASLKQIEGGINDAQTTFQQLGELPPSKRLPNAARIVKTNFL
jgi:hypothetical protein